MRPIPACEGERGKCCRRYRTGQGCLPSTPAPLRGPQRRPGCSGLELRLIRVFLFLARFISWLLLAPVHQAWSLAGDGGTAGAWSSPCHSLPWPCLQVGPKNTILLPGTCAHLEEPEQSSPVLLPVPPLLLCQCGSALPLGAPGWHRGPAGAGGCLQVHWPLAPHGSIGGKRWGEQPVLLEAWEGARHIPVGPVSRHRAPSLGNWDFLLPEPIPPQPLTLVRRSQSLPPPRPDLAASCFLLPAGSGAVRDETTLK